ncbi:MAG TPA: HD domain-containing protein [Anaerolineales bacterium]|nr:HD domain-containing protein [Anaerolineales bacterium]
MPEPFHPSKGPFVRELKPGDRITGFYIVRHKQLEPFRDRSRGQFLTLLLSDRTGSALARVWEGAPELADTFEQGETVKVQGDVELYMDRLQIIILKLRPASADEYDLRDFQPATEKNVDEMLAAVQNAANRIQHAQLNALARHFYDDPEFLRLFSAAPAARRVHHAYLGGLLEHTVEVLELCETILRLYPALNTDLLLTGALLHDIGKVREYRWDKDIEYTDEGQLVGHINISDEMAARAMAQIGGFPDELAWRVRHMILSHHGRYEWGSPRRPQTLEAMALHQIEELDAQVNRFQTLLANRPEGEAWTPFDRRLGRSLYAGRDDLEIDEQSQED